MFIFNGSPPLSNRVSMSTGLLLLFRTDIFHNAIHQREEKVCALSASPFTHVFGMLLVCSGGLYLGSCTVVQPRFHLETFLDAVQKYKVICLNKDKQDN